MRTRRGPKKPLLRRPRKREEDNQADADGNPDPHDIPQSPFPLTQTILQLLLCRPSSLVNGCTLRTICECRRTTGWGPRLVAGATGFAHSTVWKVLRRFGLSRPERAPREPANRYEWPCPGDLLHMDVSRYARFLRPATG